MPLGDFVEAGTTPKPRYIGRTLRLVFGLGTTSYFVSNIWNISAYNDRILIQSSTVSITNPIVKQGVIDTYGANVTLSYSNVENISRTCGQVGPGA